MASSEAQSTLSKSEAKCLSLVSVGARRPSSQPSPLQVIQMGDSSPVAQLDGCLTDGCRWFDGEVEGEAPKQEIVWDSRFHSSVFFFCLFFFCVVFFGGRGRRDKTSISFQHKKATSCKRRKELKGFVTDCMMLGRQFIKDAGEEWGWGWGLGGLEDSLAI